MGLPEGVAAVTEVFPGQPRFWADDFDMDLLRVVPEIGRMLGGDCDRTLWTVGHRTYGRLNHPTVWNTHGAYLWLTKPNLPRDVHGWFNVDGCVSNDEEIECTWLELLRDAWVHGFAAVMLPSRTRLRPAPQRAFDQIMWDRRGWRKSDTAGALAVTIDWIMAWHEALVGLVTSPTQTECRP